MVGPSSVHAIYYIIVVFVGCSFCDQSGRAVYVIFSPCRMIATLPVPKHFLCTKSATNFGVLKPIRTVFDAFKLDASLKISQILVETNFKADPICA